MIIHTLPTQQSPLPHFLTTAAPLTREAFAPFGAAVCNPAPDRLPHNTAPSAVAATLPCGAKSANQGSAIQYRDLGADVRNLYPGRCSSGAPATPRLTMFVCGARELRRRRPDSEASREEGGASGSSSSGGGSGGDESFFEVKILERHPFTTQTFCPLGVDPSGPRRYLVIVAPSLPLPAPPSAPPPSQGGSSGSEGEDSAALRQGQGGLPDIRNLRAFVATGSQAVTYGAGTWHAPMVALGPAGSAVDFVVTQFANGVDVEDCQEVVLKRDRGGNEGGHGGGGQQGNDVGDDSSGVWIRIVDEVDDNTLSRPTKL
ncbi:hypothetical protein SLS62_002034 [Diatrype stigma]|uniref:Ureidoglycolate hydrolase n=1 Tax=Diatrype stigma TaxID=117547 RepID=A0AAN9UYU1_9PEZI